MLTRPHKVTNRWFAGFTISMASWVLGIAWLETETNLELASRTVFAAASLMPATFLVFCDVYPTPRPGHPRGLVLAAFFIGIAFAVACVGTPLVAYDVTRTPAGLTRKPGPLYLPFAMFFLSETLAALSLLLRKWREARGVERAQLQYLATGLVLTGIGGISTNLVIPLVTGRSVYSWLGPYFLLPMVVLVGHTIIRHRLFDVRLVIHRTVGYGVTTTVVSWVIIFLGYALVPVWRVEPVRVPFAALVVAAVAAVVVSTGFAPRLARLMDRYFFRGRVRYDYALREAARRLTMTGEPREVATQLRKTLSDTVMPEFGVLVVQAPDGTNRELLFADSAEDINTEMAELVEAGWRVAVPTPGIRLAADIEKEISPRDVQTLIASRVELWIGLGRPDRKVGVMMLGPRRSGDAYFTSELDFLEALAELASIALEVAYLHDQHLRLERERQREAQLASMGRVYAGLAHEIRTPLSTISNLVSLLPDRYDDPEYRKLMIDLVPREVDRIVALSERLRVIRLNEAISFQDVELAQLLKDVVAIQVHVVEALGVKIILEVPDDLPLLHGNPDNLAQLFKNLLQNAIDATPPGGHIWVRAILDRPRVRVQIIDEGTGIDPCIKGRVFDEFETTKPGGLGLGLSICQQIAQTHGATLTLEDREDAQGTRAELVFRLLRTESHRRRTTTLRTDNG